MYALFDTTKSQEKGRYQPFWDETKVFWVLSRVDLCRWVICLLVYYNSSVIYIYFYSMQLETHRPPWALNVRCRGKWTVPMTPPESNIVYHPAQIDPESTSAATPLLSATPDRLRLSAEVSCRHCTRQAAYAPLPYWSCPTLESASCCRIRHTCGTWRFRRTALGWNICRPLPVRPGPEDLCWECWRLSVWKPEGRM